MIEAWVTEPDATYIAHLDRAPESPFRAFSFYRELNEPAGGALEYHVDNRLVRDHPDLFAAGNLVWMRYRGKLRTWIVEDDEAVLDEGEAASAWRTVSGRGTLQLLGDRIVFPPGFSSGSNLDPSTWATQWRSFVNVAAGELLWDLISESNARFAAQIVRGSIQSTGSDGITADYRFENVLDDVVGPIVEAGGGSVDMEGLTFHYRTSQGVDRSATVIFEEGADLLNLRFKREEREAVTYVVGEGVGEGVFAKLAVSSQAAARRREAFYAAKEAGNVPLLELLTDGALSEHQPGVAVAVEVDESRFRLFEDYDVGDVVRVIAPSRGVDEAIQVVAAYVAEDGDRVRISLDVGAVRDDAELRLEEGIRQTRSSLGVRNRQPQGQLVPFSFGGADVFDDADTMDVFLLVPDRIYVLVEAKAQLHFREFFAPATAATSGGGTTTSSGGGATPTTSSGGSATPTSSSQAAHKHKMYEGDFVAGSGTKRLFVASQGGGGDYGMNIEVPTTGLGDVYTWSADGAHSHTVSVPAHDHSVTVPAHDHTTPDHAHGLAYGVHKETFPASHSVELRVYERVGSSWTLRTTITGLADDVEDVDLTQWITGPGSWRISLKSAAGQPNGGRLGCDVAGYVLGAIKSA